MVTTAYTPEALAALDVLRQRNASITDVLRAITVLDQSDTAFREVKIGIAANVTVDLLATYLRRYAYLAGVRLEVLKGSYDNLLDDTEEFCRKDVKYFIIIPFFDNLLPAWEAQISHLDDDARQEPIIDYLSRLRLALERASAIGSLIIANAHCWRPPISLDGKSPQTEAITQFNTALHNETSRRKNVRILDAGAIVTMLGVHQAFDPRFYYRSKAPYTPLFLDRFSRQVSLITHEFGSIFYKVLVLDCDNTLWGGIVGEDGMAGIKLNPYTYPGNMFWSIQHQILALEKHGMLICLCSKNNPADVDEIFNSHACMVLKNEHITIKKINWIDKVTNLKELAIELNLGLDSFIFIDDSHFEIEAVRNQLPMVRAFQVPDHLPDYPEMLREVIERCLSGGVSVESHSKTQQYRQLAAAAAAQDGFSSRTEYLRSLNLRVKIYRDAVEQIARISELTMKSNQFNLTTRRLTPGDITQLMNSPTSTVYSFSVTDRFGECGITGIIIVEYYEDACIVKDFLMSCRVIGRGVEFSVWKIVLDDAYVSGKSRLVSKYLPSEKNAQVADFFDRLGFDRVDEKMDGSRYYEALINEVFLTESDWVEVINAG
jgi:FkbH-like protein